MEQLLSQIDQYFGTLSIHTFVTDDALRVIWQNRAASESEPKLTLGESIEPYYQNASDPNWKQNLALPKTAFSFFYLGMYFDVSVQRLTAEDETCAYLWHWTRSFHPASSKEGEQLLFSKHMIELLRERVFHIYNNLLPMESEFDRLGAYENSFYLNAIAQDCYTVMKNVINSELYAKIAGNSLTPQPDYFIPGREFPMLDLYLQQIFSNTERKITVTVDSSAQDAVLYTDWYLLMICLLNLIANAVEHTPEEGSIELFLRRLGDRITISVRDDGDGMDPEIRSLAMEEMYSYNTSSERVENFGLGLYLCNQIVRMLGGTFVLSSEEFHGTMVSISLPAAEKPQQKIPFCDELARWGRDKLSPLYAFLAPLGHMKFF